MNVASTADWVDANQRALVAELSRIRTLLEARLSEHSVAGSTPPPAYVPIVQPADDTVASAPSALDAIVDAFGLSVFERDVLLLCAGTELDAHIASLIRAANGDTRRANATFALALAALPDAHWSALAPAAPLRRWSLIEVGAGELLTTSALRVDERVLHFLAGVGGSDARLHGLVHRIDAPALIADSQQALVDRLVSTVASRTASLPLLQLWGESAADQRGVAAATAAALGLRLHRVRAVDVSAAPLEREWLARMIEREAILGKLVALIDLTDAQGAEYDRAIALANSINGLVMTTSAEPLRDVSRETISIEVQRPPAREQHVLWQSAMGPLAARLNGTLEAVAREFQFGAQDICDVTDRLRLNGLTGTPAPTDEEPSFDEHVWHACRVHARTRLDSLAQRINSTAKWKDLILPDTAMQTLRTIAMHARHRFRVYDSWGFAGKSSRGLGISVLFTGASGTGKTMAAEVLANELHLDLFRIDLSSVVSKYIGETEKNLRRVFDAAEAGGAILLFDEADALFGKRSEVKDSHDRYANIEVGYLLQRMEAYRGLAILTSNMKNALDHAFLRRLRFVVQFPVPDTAERTVMWKRVFPMSAPTDGLDVDKLARLHVSGGNIRNIALNAAFLAAATNEPVQMRHLLDAARSECAKLDRAFSDAEFGGWV